MLSCNVMPYPPTRGAAEGRTFNLIKYLREHGHQITLLSQRYGIVQDADITAIQAWVDQLVLFPFTEFNPKPGVGGKLRRFVESVSQSTPPNILSRYDPTIQQWVDEFVLAGHCDVIVGEHSTNEMYIRPEFRERVRTVVDVHSSVYGWVRNHLDMGVTDNMWRDRLYLPLLYRYEQRYCQKFTRLIATTPEDKTQLLQISPGSDITIISNGVDLTAFPMRPQDPGGHRLIFVAAMDSTHNIDAACYLALELFPRIRARYPEATLSLVGARPVPKVQELGRLSGVTVTGAVPSLVEYLHQSTVCLIPLRVGLGIKTKTLESMATGIPIVGSDRALEGLPVDRPGVPLRALRANRLEEYVDAVSRVFDDPSLRAELSYNARQMLETEYTWERAGQRYVQVLAGEAVAD